MIHLQCSEVCSSSVFSLGLNTGHDISPVLAPKHMRDHHKSLVHDTETGDSHLQVSFGHINSPEWDGQLHTLLACESEIIGLVPNRIMAHFPSGASLVFLYSVRPSGSLGMDFGDTPRLTR
jgi:hypothetical protein